MTMDPGSKFNKIVTKLTTRGGICGVVHTTEAGGVDGNSSGSICGTMSVKDMQRNRFYPVPG